MQKYFIIKIFFLYLKLLKQILLISIIITVWQLILKSRK